METLVLATKSVIEPKLEEHEPIKEDLPVYELLNKLEGHQSKEKQQANSQKKSS